MVDFQQIEKIHFILEQCGDDDAKRRALLGHLTKNGFSALHVTIYKV